MPGGDPLAELVLRLRGAGLDPDAEQLCDALWLARWTRPADAADGGPPVTAGPAARPGSRPSGLPLVPPPEETGRSVHEPEPSGDPAARRVALYPMPPGARRDGRDDRDGQEEQEGRHGRGVRGVRGAGRARALPVGVPAAPVLPAPLELQRALRPLQGYRSPAPPLRTELDEVATAEVSARAGGLILPVHRSVTRRDARLQLVLDTSSSMHVWGRLFDELAQIFGQLGAFSDIQVSHLHQGPDGGPAVSRSPDARGAPLHSADRLSDPTGRRIVVLVSDCAGPLWHSGHAGRGPAAVPQPLPQRMWNRTRFPVTFGGLSRGDTLGGGAVLRLRTTSGTPAEARRGALAVPVLPPEAVALGSWARLLSGAGPVPGAVGWVRADQPAGPTARPDRRRTPLERVSRFSAAASPAAARLAVYLAATPLCLPVMQLVQRTMLPGSGPSELAEVLVGGLVSRARGDHGGDGAQWYDIEPDVREALLSRLGRDEAMLVLKHCSEYIEQHFGKGGPNFPALALAQLGDGGPGPARPHGTGTGADRPGDNGSDGSDGGDGSDGDGDADNGGRAGKGDNGSRNGNGGNGGNGGADPVPQPFAEIAARILERFMPLPEQFATYDSRTDPRPAADRPTHLGGDSALLQGAVGMLEAFADTWPDRPDRPSELLLAHGRTLLRLSEVTADPDQVRLYAEQSAQSLRRALESGRTPDTAGSVRVRVRILTDLVDALLRAGGPLDEAQARTDEALGRVREQTQRAALLVRAGRVAVARYAESGEPPELHGAADRFAQAARWMPRDAPAHADVLAEWGTVLLRLAALEDGRGRQELLSRAIRVLRDCRMETPAGSRQVSHRLLLLGRGLMLRYQARGDRIDLREAAHLFGLAAADARDPLLAAHCRLELGQAQFEAFQSLSRATRLDVAVDAFRAAAESARRAEEEAETQRRRHDAVQLAAQAHHWRGMTFEAAARPRAAHDAYRAARAEWARLPDDRLVTGEPTAQQTAQRLADLEGDR
nr:SAV_2336 N-terminal domain-related protein [Streptomyces sp. FXJ7.023]